MGVYLYMILFVDGRTTTMCKVFVTTNTMAASIDERNFDRKVIVKTKEVAHSHLYGTSWWRSCRTLTDRERHECRVGLQHVVLVQPTVRVECDRILPYFGIHVTLIEIGTHHGVLWQIIASECDRFADDVCNRTWC